MPYDANGNWIPDDASVQTQLSAITSKDSAVMRQAGAAGMRAANRRGLMNSTMGIGAGQSEMLKVATPMASQNASQIATADINRQNLAAAERERQLAAVTSLATSTQNAYGSTLTNPDIPASMRAAVQQSITDQQRAALAAMERLYGNKINWGSPASASYAPASTTYNPTLNMAGGIGGAMYR